MGFGPTTALVPKFRQDGKCFALIVLLFAHSKSLIVFFPHNHLGHDIFKMALQFSFILHWCSLLVIINRCSQDFFKGNVKEACNLLRLCSQHCCHTGSCAEVNIDSCLLLSCLFCNLFLLTDLAKQEKAGANLCKHFLRGRCHFGDRCRLSHSMPSPATLETPTTELECLDGLEKEEKYKKNKKKMSRSQKKEQMKEFEINEPPKKSRMRTADEVINRIRWDSAIDSSQFLVGHIDRFLGVLERPFDEFSWDTSVTDCDYSEELALPRHRIQYFSYRGQRVWDKDSRTDRVFGSTGQTVLPPFGGEAQQQEDVTQQRDNSLDSAEQQQMPHVDHKESHENFTEAQMGEQENTRRRNDDGACRTDLDGSPFRDVAAGSGGEQQTGSDISSGEPEARKELVLGNFTQLTLSQTNSGIKSDEEKGWNGQEEEDLPLSPDRQALSSTVASSPQEEPRPGRRKCKPTHFIGFRVHSPAALHAFQRLQAKVLAQLPQSEPHWVSPAVLHVTLSLLVLPGPAEVFAASELLRTVVKELHKPPIDVTFTPKLKHFAGKVLHLVPQPLSDIQTLNAPIQQAFREKGWLHRDSRCPNYHMTLAKVEEDRLFENVGLIKLGKDINFGKLKVQKLCLCACGQPRTESGFYDTVCAVTIPEI
ncbi:hypothetical protein ACEWY4_019518 [Coilia grayii]|uniref:C3H1-type domain-containing protein n=1 Tax=Coilia grayii TaxID=363190 RepID=A0ABD1JCE6_9TELE